MPNTIQIEFSFDLVCPWCLIGKVSLEQALGKLREQYPSVEVNIEWKGMQLLPDVPERGLSFQDFYEKRLGSREAVSLRQQQVNDAAAHVDLHINFQRIKTFPNTANAHALLACMSAHCGTEAEEKLLDRLFEIYFFMGGDIGDKELICQLVNDCEISREILDVWLDSPESNVVMNGCRPQVASVPHYVFNQKTEISGAQTPEKLLSAMLNILQGKLQ